MLPAALFGSIIPLHIVYCLFKNTRTSQNNYSQSDDLPLVHKCIVQARTLVMMIRVCHDEGSTSSLQQV
jgi:hypothetical protein